MSAQVRQAKKSDSASRRDARAVPASNAAVKRARKAIADYTRTVRQEANQPKQASQQSDGAMRMCLFD